jgi:hypothetical protein
MPKYDLSILIPARNEEWLPQTVENLLKNKRGKTEILIGLDGYWPEPGIPSHEDVTVVHYPESIGQRAMQNRLAQISKAKYVMKADAHTAWDEGFDVKLIAKMEDDVTMVPQMYNLHVFNWQCKSCGMEWYQGPQPQACRNETCDSISWTADNNPNYATNFEKKLYFHPRNDDCFKTGVDCSKRRANPQSSAYRFNKNLQFKYFPELRNKLPREGLQETMSLQGSCFMCTREKYWSLGLCDESWGSWGQQGSEVAIKTWLSGGRVLTNFDTWYAHLFRTQSGFSFPYPHSGRSQQRAREISQEIFLNDKWPMAKYPLKWLLNKFWFALKDVQDPEARWTEADVSGPTKGCIYYTDNRLDDKIAQACREQIKRANLPIVSASLKPIDFGTNIVIDRERGYETYFMQIIAALEKLETDIVFFCEHDVLYAPSHFEFTPTSQDTFYYDQNVYRWKYPTDIWVTWDAHQVAQLVCYRTLALDWYKKKLEQYLTSPIKVEDKNQTLGDRKWDRKFEPEDKFEDFRSLEPSIDIRHEANLTKSKWSVDDFRNKASAVNFKQVKCPRWIKGLI